MAAALSDKVLSVDDGGDGMVMRDEMSPLGPGKHFPTANVSYALPGAQVQLLEDMYGEKWAVKRRRIRQASVHGLLDSWEVMLQPFGGLRGWCWDGHCVEEVVCVCAKCDRLGVDCVGCWVMEHEEYGGPTCLHPCHVLHLVCPPS